MPDLVLHQYELSPFSEKIRRVLARKGLHYRSVRAPAVMPKPDVVALTGGYRKIPLLQMENHVYCDTALIADVVERLQPEPTLYPTPMARSLAEWFDATAFETIMPFVARPTRFDEALRLLTPDELSNLGADRAAMRDPTRRKPPGYKTARALLAVYLGRVDRTVAMQPFLLGAEPCIADFSAYAMTWLLEKIAPGPLEPFTAIPGWMERVAAITGPAPEPLSSAEALGIAAAAGETWEPVAPFDDPSGFAQGQPIVIRAADYGCDPVEGTLAHAGANEVVLRRTDPRAGTVFVHFPRIGYEIVAA